MFFLEFPCLPCELTTVGNLTVRDRVAWYATVHGVARSKTCLGNRTKTTTTYLKAIVPLSMPQLNFEYFLRDLNINKPVNQLGI